MPLPDRHISAITRRTFTAQLLKASGAILAAPALVRAQSGASPSIRSGGTPEVTHGVASGDATFDSAIIWSRSDRAARMRVEWSTDDSFKTARTVRGDVTKADHDFTAKLRLTGLPAGERVFYRVRFEGSGGARDLGSPVTGEFKTAARTAQDVFFAWSGDTCGQGYGIDRSRGGLRSFEALRAAQPDFFIHSGDTCYTDGVLEREMKLPDGTVWRNLVTPEKSKVAETLDEYHGNHRYNLLDEHVRTFNASVPIFAQWDDHEVRNNWYPGQQLDDPRYRIRDVEVLARHGRQAFLDYWPVRPNWRDRIYRTIDRGPLCEVFMIDLRTYRGPNNPNRQTKRDAMTDYLGQRQLWWLQRKLAASRATWKIIASDMPIGLLVGDGKNAFENCANGNGPALGRELEVAELLRFIQREKVNNTIWLTADVHYAASHYYQPQRAQFTEFNPFWEFVSGPLHAGAFGPGTLDNTFGPEARWNSREKGSKGTGPYTEEQFFGTVAIDARTKAARVTHCNQSGKKLWEIELPAAV